MITRVPYLYCEAVTLIADDIGKIALRNSGVLLDMQIIKTSFLLSGARIQWQEGHHHLRSSSTTETIPENPGPSHQRARKEV